MGLTHTHTHAHYLSLSLSISSPFYKLSLSNEHPIYPSNILLHIHTETHTNSHRHTCAHTHTSKQTQMHTHKHTNTRTYTYTHTHAHKLTHTQLIFSHVLLLTFILNFIFYFAKELRGRRDSIWTYFRQLPSPCCDIL